MPEPHEQPERVKPILPKHHEGSAEYTESPPEAEPGKVNVILHGLFIPIFDAENVTVLVPEVSPDHVYRAGNWLGETTLQAGEFELQGVEGGSAEPKVNQNLVFVGVDRSEKAPYATIRMKRPESIQALRRAPLKARDCFAGNPAVSQDSEAWSGILVFTYTYTNDAEVTLAGHPWQPMIHKEPGLVESPEESFINLHIFAEPEIALDFGHMTNEFNLVAQLFTNLSLNFTCAPHVPRLEIAELPRGVIPEEAEELSARARRLTRLGRLRRDKVPVDEAWDGTEAFAIESGACAGCNRL